MRQLRLIGYQLGYEQRSFWRNPPAAFFTFAFPIVMLVIFATMNKSNRVDSLGVSYTQYYIPSMVAFGVMGACFTNLGATMCLRRQSGYLKRIRTTPLRPSVFFVGVIAHTLAVALLLTALIVTIGAFAYNVPLPRHWTALIAQLAVGAVTFCAMGIAAATVAPDAEAAPVVLNGLFYPLLFISGAFYPVPGNSVLGQIANLFPLVHFIDGTFSAFSTDGGGVAPHQLLVVAAWGVVAMPIAARNFRWSPIRR